MTSTVPRGGLAAAGALVCALVAACSSVNLNAPPVEDWSNTRGTQVTRPGDADLYTVQRNDTLASIAARFGTTPANLAAWNSLPATARVSPNQVLRVTPPSPMTPATPTDAGPVATTSPIGSEGVEQRPINQSGATGATAIPPASSNAPLKNTPLGLKKPYSDATLAEMSRPDSDVPATAAPSPLAAPATTAGPQAVNWAWPTSGRPSTTFGDGKTKGVDIPGKAGDPVLAAADGKVTFVGAGVRGYGNFVIIRHSPDVLSVYANNRVNLVKGDAVVTRGQKIAELGNSDSDAVKLHFEIRSDGKPVDPLKFLPPR